MEHIDHLKFTTGIGRLEVESPCREAWLDDTKIAVLEKVNNEWIVSCITSEQMQCTIPLHTLELILKDFQEFLKQFEA